MVRMVSPQPIQRKCFQLTSGDRYIISGPQGGIQPCQQLNNNYYRKNFAYTGAKVWNALQDELKCERSIGGFKDRLDSINLSIEVQFFIVTKHSPDVYSQVVNILINIGVFFFLLKKINKIMFHFLISEEKKVSISRFVCQKLW